MHIRGIRSVSLYTERIDSAINSKIDSLKIKESFKIFCRVFVGIIPAIAGSLFPSIITPVFIFISIWFLYIALNPVQENLFKLNDKERYLHITMPFNALFLFWAFGLAVCGFGEQIARSVGPMVVLAAVSIWPVFIGKKNYEKGHRKTPYKAVYSVFSVIVLIQQLLIIGGHF